MSKAVESVDRSTSGPTPCRVETGRVSRDRNDG